MVIHYLNNDWYFSLAIVDHRFQFPIFWLNFAINVFQEEFRLYLIGKFC